MHNIFNFNYFAPFRKFRRTTCHSPTARDLGGEIQNCLLTPVSYGFRIRTIFNGKGAYTKNSTIFSRRPTSRACRKAAAYGHARVIRRDCNKLSAKTTFYRYVVHQISREKKKFQRGKNRAETRQKLPPETVSRLCVVSVRIYVGITNKLKYMVSDKQRNVRDNACITNSDNISFVIL